MDFKETRLYMSPWVPGTRALAYFGPVSASYRVRKINSHGLYIAMLRSARRLIEKANKLEANTVVGLEVTIDIFSKRPVIKIVGTAAKLENLF